MPRSLRQSADLRAVSGHATGASDRSRLVDDAEPERQAEVVDRVRRPAAPPAAPRSPSPPAPRCEQSADPRAAPRPSPSSSDCHHSSIRSLTSKPCALRASCTSRIDLAEQAGAAQLVGQLAGRARPSQARLGGGRPALGGALRDDDVVLVERDRLAGELSGDCQLRTAATTSAAGARHQRCGDLLGVACRTSCRATRKLALTCTSTTFSDACRASSTVRDVELVERRARAARPAARPSPGRRPASAASGWRFFTLALGARGPAELDDAGVPAPSAADSAASTSEPSDASASRAGAPSRAGRARRRGPAARAPPR